MNGIVRGDYMLAPSDRRAQRRTAERRMALEELARMPDPTTVFLVRHGQTDWIAKGIAGRLPDVRLRAYDDALQILGVNDTGDLHA
jgi:hypothetical protein